MTRQVLLNLPHERAPVEWPEPRQPAWKQGRMGVTIWYGPLSSRYLEDSDTILMLEAQRTANRLMGVDLSQRAQSRYKKAKGRKR